MLQPKILTRRHMIATGRLAVWVIALLATGQEYLYAQAVAAPETRLYDIRHADVNTARDTLLTILGDSAAKARIVADPTAKRLIVVAPAEVHTKIVELLPQVDQAVAKTQAAGGGSLQLRSVGADALGARLQRILGARLVIRKANTGDWLGFDIDQKSRAAITIWANSKTGQVQFVGPPAQKQAWRQVLQTLDSPPNNATATQFVATRPSAAAKVRQAVDVLGDSGLVTLTAQTDQKTDNQAGASLLGPVQIERVADTDLLLLRGDPDDVRRVLEVIKQIETLAMTSEPRIEVVALEHVDSKALAEMIAQVFSQSLNNYGYGRLVAMPLGKPNAILLVGLPTTVGKAREILKQLDQPGKAPTQFETFHLKHARADDARQIVENLFSQETAEGAPTLGPKAQVIADVRTNALIVRAGPRDMEEVRALVKEIDRVGSESVNELRVFKLRSSLAEDVEKVLRDALGNDPNGDNAGLSRLLRLVTINEQGRRRLESGVLAEVNVNASQSANALVVIAPAESMSLLAALIEQLDQAPDAAIDLKIIPVENGDATALADMLGRLFGAGADNENNPSGGPGKSGIASLRVEVDERTNSILVAGTREDLITVEAVLRTLDSTDARQRKNEVYRLKNKPVAEVATALQEWLRAERDVQATAPGTASPFQQIEREVIVVPEIASNSLIVSATPRYYKEVANIIEQLDARDPMVMIQVLIASVELGNIDEFGVELGLQDSVLFDRSLLSDLVTTTNSTTVFDSAGNSTSVQNQVIQGATNTPGFNFGNPNNGLGNSGSDISVATAGRVAGQAISSFGVNRVSTEGGFGGFVLSASSDAVSMLLRALQESRRLDVLSRPQIMALDNQLGTAFVGQTVPFITSSTIDQFTGQPNSNIQRIQVGLNLEVTPRVSPDGLIVMEIFAANERLRPITEGVPIAIAPNGAPINSPIVDTIQARTTVSAVSGQTVVLSGLLTKEDRALHRRVPLLADIPLLGNMFRFDSVSTVRRELLIILTPHIINNRFESEMLNQVESARMSWCLSDVIDIHGPVGLRSQNDLIGVTQAEDVFPEEIPAPDMLPTPVESPQLPIPPQSNTPAVEETKKSSFFRLPKFLSRSDDDTTNTQ